MCVSLSLARALCNHLFFCLRPCLQNQKTKTRGIPNPPPHKKRKNKTWQLFLCKTSSSRLPQPKKQSQKNTSTNKRSRDFWQLQSAADPQHPPTEEGIYQCQIKRKKQTKTNKQTKLAYLLALAYQSKDIVFRFIIEYSSLRDFGP